MAQSMAQHGDGHSVGSASHATITYYSSDWLDFNVPCTLGSPRQATGQVRAGGCIAWPGYKSRGQYVLPPPQHNDLLNHSSQHWRRKRGGGQGACAPPPPTFESGGGKDMFVPPPPLSDPELRPRHRAY